MEGSAFHIVFKRRWRDFVEVVPEAKEDDAALLVPQRRPLRVYGRRWIVLAVFFLLGAWPGPRCPAVRSDPACQR